MKKVLLAMIALTTFAANAQEAQEGFKGRWFAMGEVGYSTQNDGDNKSFIILPAVGTFIAPTTAVGLAVGYQNTTEKYTGGKHKQDAFIIKPLARQYWGVSDSFFLFGEAAVPLAFGKIGDVKYSSVGVDLSVGVDYFITNNWSVEAKIGAAGWNSVKPKGGDASNDFNIGISSGLAQGVSFGFKYVF